MKFIQGKDRDQIEFFSLSQAVSEDNEVRLIDLFVRAIKLADYGYMNRIRSSRQLEKECKRNLELMWLMKGLAPDHNTIANFRKKQPESHSKSISYNGFTCQKL